MQYKHVSPAAVAAVLAAGEIAITLLEVPTGRFADRFGHRRSLILGSAIQVIAMLLCWLAEGVSGLVLASVCVALGDTFRSGADQALLFESCVAEGEPQRFQPIESTTHSLELIGLVVMIVAGGVLVETMGFAAAWIAETVLAASGLAIAVAMVSPPATPTRSADALETDAITCATFRPLRVIAPAALIGGAASAITFMAQTSETATAMQLTVLVSVITVSEAAGAALARYLRADVATQYLLLTTALLFVAVAAVAPGLFLPGVVMLSMLTGAAEPLRATAIQLVIEQRRAEAASWPARSMERSGLWHCWWRATSAATAKHLGA